MISNIQTDILILCVLYNQPLSSSKTFKSLLMYNHNVMLIDNSNQSFLDIPITSTWEYVNFINNPGLGHAYNYAVQYAKEKGYDWILITDQDTHFPSNAIEIYGNAIENNPDIKLFLPKVKIRNGKFMSPVKSMHYFSQLTMSPPLENINPAKYAIINSGLCINVDAFLEVGGYNEKVWLDFADIQFIERFANKYNKAYVVDLECIQSFSNEDQDSNQKMNRYKLFCDSIKHYEPINQFNKFWIFCVTLKRALSLSKQLTSLKPLYIFIKYYII